jgi:phosphoribosylformylglycinamidine synthase
VPAKVEAQVKVEVEASLALTSTSVAFSESLSRFIVEVAPDDAAAFETRFAGLAAPCAPSVCAQAGRVRADDKVQLVGLDGQLFVDTTLAAIEHAWRGHLT